jgi:tetratricopeptide (TPR) repeat protein
MASEEKQTSGTAPDSGRVECPSGNREEAVYAVGMEYFSDKRYAEAAACFEQTLVLNDRHSGARKFLGMAAYYQGRFRKAIDSLQQYLEKEPEDPQVLWFCGMCYLELIQYADAERFLRRLSAADPQSALACRSLGLILYRRGLYNDSVLMLKKALELEPGDHEAYFQLGEAYNKLDEIDQAVTCFETVLQFQKDNPKAFYNLGILYDKKGMPEKASSMYRQAKELSLPRERRRHARPVEDAEGKGLFFSRSLTLVAETPETVPAQQRIDQVRYEKFRRSQMRKKKVLIVPVEAPAAETHGTMDLTKASLNIEEAIRIIKEKRE